MFIQAFDGSQYCVNDKDIYALKKYQHETKSKDLDIDYNRQNQRSPHSTMNHPGVVNSLEKFGQTARTPPE